MKFVKTCIHCGKPAEVEVPLDAAKRILDGEFIQTAWPQATPDQREMVISGTHPACWDAMFADEDD